MVSLFTVPVVGKTSDLRAGVKPSLEPQELGYASALVLLAQFKHAMASDGLTVSTQRMLHSSAYALEQLALGHTSNNLALRQCAMRVFALFHE